MCSNLLLRNHDFNLLLLSTCFVGSEERVGSDGSIKDEYFDRIFKCNRQAASSIIIMKLIV